MSEEFGPPIPTSDAELIRAGIDARYEAARADEPLLDNESRGLVPSSPQGDARWTATSLQQVLVMVAPSRYSEAEIGGIPNGRGSQPAEVRVSPRLRSV